MPFLFKHRRPPEPWHEIKRGALHKSLLPLYYGNWIGDWSVYFLSKWSVFEILEYVGSFSILLAVIFYFADAGDRTKQKHYQAWQVINTAQGKGGSGGRIEALQELNEDRVPLVGVDVADAYLQEVRLVDADLRRSDFRGADLRNAILRKSDLEGANLRSANLRGADLRSASLLDANLYDSDLTGATLADTELRGAKLERADLRSADLRGVREWRQIASIRLANVHGVRNVPDGFLAWAKSMGAVDAAEDKEWEKLVGDVPATRE